MLRIAIQLHPNSHHRNYNEDLIRQNNHHKQHGEDTNSQKPPPNVLQ
jgi:hypothetical protein